MIEGELGLHCLAVSQIEAHHKVRSEAMVNAGARVRESARKARRASDIDEPALEGLRERLSMLHTRK